VLIAKLSVGYIISLLHNLWMQLFVGKFCSQWLTIYVLYFKTPHFTTIWKLKFVQQSCWINQEIPHLSWNSSVHYRVRLNPPDVAILDQTNLGHKIPPYFSNIHFNVILPSDVSRPRITTFNPFHDFYMPGPCHYTAEGEFIFMPRLLVFWKMMLCIFK
jgi:hypothetical protein